MSHELIAKELAGAKERITLIYAFNATGKTRLSVAYKDATKDGNGAHAGVYYNAYSEDLFVWDNDEENDGANVRLTVLPSSLSKFHSLMTEDNVRDKLNAYKPKFGFAFNSYEDDQEKGIESISFFIPNHGPRVFVAGEVDMVSGPGYNPARFAPGMKMDYIDLRRIVTDLCVMDFGGPDHAVRVRSLHPGVTFEQVQAATGFQLSKAPDLTETPLPTDEQLSIIRGLDPHNLRASTLKNDPPAIRKAA